MNTCYKHFYYFVTEFNIVDKKELEPLVSLLLFIDLLVHTGDVVLLQLLTMHPSQLFMKPGAHWRCCIVAITYYASISASSFLLCSSGFAHIFLSPNIPHHNMSLRV